MNAVAFPRTSNLSSEYIFTLARQERARAALKAERTLNKKVDKFVALYDMVIHGRPLENSFARAIMDVCVSDSGFRDPDGVPPPDGFVDFFTKHLFALGVSHIDAEWAAMSRYQTTLLKPLPRRQQQATTPLTCFWNTPFFTL